MQFHNKSQFLQRCSMEKRTVTKEQGNNGTIHLLTLILLIGLSKSMALVVFASCYVFLICGHFPPVLPSLDVNMYAFPEAFPNAL